MTHGTVYTGRSISPEMIQQYMSTQLGECGQQTLKSSDTQTQSPSRPDADKLNVWITGHSSSKPSICSPRYIQPLCIACIHMPSFGATVILAISAAATPSAPPICNSIYCLSTSHVGLLAL